ncbi:unnamed protein product, partial [Allacma fusca]
CLGTFRSA